MRKEVMCILPECPPRDSNPHCIDPKSIASTDWARRATPAPVIQAICYYRRTMMSSCPRRARTSNMRFQRPPFCRLNYRAIITYPA